MPISFSHAAHADKVKREFLQSASNTDNCFFLGSLKLIVPPSYESFIRTVNAMIINLI